MADYSAKIQLIVEGLQALDKVEQKLKELNKIVQNDLRVDVKANTGIKKIGEDLDAIAAKGRAAAKSIQDSFKNIGGIAKGGLIAGVIVGINQFGAALEAASTKAGLFGPALDAIGSAVKGTTPGVDALVNAFAALPPALQATAPAIAAVTAGLLAFNQPIRTAIADTKTLVDALNPVKNAISSAFGTAVLMAFSDQLDININTVNDYRSSLLSLTDTVSALSRRKSNLQSVLNSNNASTETAAKIAGKLVDVTKRLNDEQQAQNDLLRQASGLRSESVERKATNTYNVTQRRKTYEQEQLNKLNAEIADYNRLATEAAAVTKSWEDKLTTIGRVAAAGPLGTSSQLSTRLAEFIRNKQSAQIAREASAAALAREQMLAGGTYSLDVLPAGKTLAPGGTTTTAQTQYRNYLNQVATVQSAVADAAERTNRSQRQLEIAAIGTNKSFTQRFEISQAQNSIDERSVQIARERNAELAKELGIEINIGKATEAKGLNAGMFKSRVGSAVSSALIGGGFPLLFGQSSAAAAGGAIGGFGGGLIGGGFGFALSIIGTGLGEAIDKSEKFNQALAALNVEVSNTGSTSKITAEDVKTLAKNLGIAEEEATKVYSAFTGFNNANITKSLAAVFGTDATAFQSLAAVKDKADLAKVILDTYQKIGLQTATELINQLKIKDATTVEIAFLKVKLDTERKVTEEKLKQVGFMDYISSALANSRNLMVTSGGIPTGQINLLTPQDIANQRAAAYRRGLPPANQVIKDVEKALASLRSASTTVSAFSPDKAAKKAADEAAKEAERVQQVVRDREANAQFIQIQSNFQDKIAAAEKARDPILAARLKGEQEILDIQYDYAKQLADEKNSRAQEAITFEGLSKIAAKQRDTEREINKLYAERQQKVTDTVNSLQLELDLKRATTEEERNQIQLRYDMARLREQGYSDTQITQIETLRKQVAAPKTPSELLKGRFGALTDELTKLTNVGQMAITAADGIGNAFGQAFQGLVTGAMTAQQALSSFFKSVGDMFISMATEIIAKMVTMYAIKTLLNLFSPGTKGGDLGSVNMVDLSKYSAPLGYATGGFVTGPTNAVVGEGGQPEYIIPASKMAAAMSRYSAGTRGAAVIPVGGGTATTSTDITAPLPPAPIDVRYTVERINSVDYVTNDQFQQGMAQAAKQGASQGEQRTLRRLQMSNSTRKKVGI